MGKKRKAPQPKTDNKPDIGLISKPILDPAYQKAIKIVSDHFGSDHPSVVTENWYEAAGALADDAEYRVQNAIIFLCNYLRYCECCGEAGHEGELAYYSSQVFGAARQIELEADIPSGAEQALQTYSRQRAALTDHNKRKGSSEQLKRDANEAIEAARAKHPSRADDIDFLKELAASTLGIGKRALNMRLAK